jgi:NADH-quinone oxidoreductase subunit D
LSRELAISAGITGPMLRASGEAYDLRKVDAYGIYDRFKFRVPYTDGEVGDCYDRFMVRMLEMRESVKILKQALADIPEGEIMGNAPRVFKPKPAEVYGRIEGPKGELGFYLIADGTPKPYRYRVRPPSLINLTVLRDMCLGGKIADAVIILGSIDIVLGEVDR